MLRHATRPHPDNAFSRARRVLDTAAGRHLSDVALAALLGVEPRHVHRLARLPDAAIRPGYLLALHAAAEHGAAWCDALPPPTRHDVQQLVAGIHLSRSQIGALLGLSRSGLRRLQHEAHPARYQWIALSYLHTHYGPASHLAGTLRLLRSLGA